MSAAWNIVNGKRIQFTHWHVITAKLFERFWLVFGASAHTVFTRCFICTTENVLILRRCFALFENLYDRRRYTKSYTHQPNLHINRMNLYVRCHTMEHPRVDRLSTPFNGLSWKSHQYNLNSCINFRGIAIHRRRNWIWGCSRFAAYSYFRFKLQFILETVPSKCPKPHTTLSAHTHTLARRCSRLTATRLELVNKKENSTIGWTRCCTQRHHLHVHSLYIKCASSNKLRNVIETTNC